MSKERVKNVEEVWFGDTRPGNREGLIEKATDSQLKASVPSEHSWPVPEAPQALLGAIAVH